MLHISPSRSTLDLKFDDFLAFQTLLNFWRPRHTLELTPMSLFELTRSEPLEDSLTFINSLRGALVLE